jgi:hypothetical protein
MKPIIILFNKVIFTTLLFLCFSARASLAAIGCDLNDPDRDVPRLFPESTSYKTRYVSIKQLGGDLLLKKIERRLGEKYLALYAPIDVPYTLYEIYGGNKKIGYIHGVNQKGQFGGIQVFMAQDLDGRIKSFYLQRISGQMANKFRNPNFCKQFIGVTIKDFDSYDPAIGKGSGRIAQIHNPSPEHETDFYGVLRGLKKNLVLMDEFIFSSGINPSIQETTEK